MFELGNGIDADRAPKQQAIETESAVPHVASAASALRAVPDASVASTDSVAPARVARMLRDADAVVIAASNGFDISDGYNQFACDEAFLERFSDFHRAYGLTSMLQGLMARWPTDEARWAFLARLIDYGYRSYSPTPVMQTLDRITANKPRFVITCNCNSRFVKAGFARDSAFETEGSYARLRCTAGCRDEDFDAPPYVEAILRADSAAQADIASRSDGIPATAPSIPSDLVPRCPNCGALLDAAVDDSGRQAAWASFRAQQSNFQAFLEAHRSERVAILELGMGQRNPTIKRPLMSWAESAPCASYAVLNRDHAHLPRIAPERTAAIAGDLAPALDAIANLP